MKKPIFTPIIAAGALLLAASTAYASVSDKVVLTKATGVVFKVYDLRESETSELKEFVDDGSSNAIGHYMLVMEPDGKTVSDAFGVEKDKNSAGKYDLIFLSDPTTKDIALFFTKQDGKSLSETANGGTFVVPTGYLTGGISNYKVTFESDGERFGLPAPDGGSTVALLGIALAGIEGLRRKLRAA